MSGRCSHISKHIQGAVSKADLNDLSRYTRRVETFVLTDLSPDFEIWSISPATYVRLAQLRIHNPDAPLFPSLKHLRIVDAKSSLFQLSFFLSNSLRSIELHNVDCTQKFVFSSFLITLADECPELSSIKLASPIPESIWEIFLKFNHLRALELKDALTQLNFSLFSTIAQAFPQLEQFILDARSTEYKRAASPDPQQWDNVAESHPQTSQSEHNITDAELSKLHSDGQDYPGLEPMSQYESMEPIESRGPTFLRLEKLHITGSLDLIQDLVESIPSRCLKEIGLTLVRSNRPKFPKKKEKRVFTGPPVRTDVETPVFATCLDKAFNTWRRTLTNIFIGQHEDYSPSDQGVPRTPVLPTLPVSVCEEILLLPMVERLDISGWTIENFLKYSAPFALIAPIYSNLKYLHLPIQSNNKGIPFSGLRLVAESFPKLVSFQSSIVRLDDADIPVSDPSKATTYVIFHGLEILSVGNASPNPNPKKVLDIARHIFALFPNLKEIRTHAGQNEDQWDYIHSLVRAFQGACLDHAARLI